MRSGISSLLLALCSIGCATPAPPLPEAAPARPPANEPAPQPEFGWHHEFRQASDAGQFAIVDVGTELRTHASTDAASCSFRGLHPGVVRVMGRQDEHVEVELDWTLDPEVHHCLSAPLATIGLRMFVLERGLAQVTVGAHTLETGEGTGILVAPGVLLRERGTGRSRRQVLYSNFGNPDQIAWSTADYFVVPLADELPPLGRVYSPVLTSSLREPIPESAAFQLAENWSGSAIDYGAGEVGVRGQVFAQKADDPNHVVLGSECLHVAGRVRGAEASGIGGMGAALRDPNAPSWTIARGTPLTWKSGGTAGQTHRELELTRPPRHHGRRSCFTPPLACDGHEGLDVCVASDSVVLMSP